jgi:hypothetical protein
MLYKKRIKDSKLIEFYFITGKSPLYLNISNKDASRYDTYYPGWLIKNEDGELVYISKPNIQELYVNSKEVIGYKYYGTNYFYDDLEEKYD